MRALLLPAALVVVLIGGGIGLWVYIDDRDTTSKEEKKRERAEFNHRVYPESLRRMSDALRLRDSKHGFDVVSVSGSVISISGDCNTLRADFQPGGTYHPLHGWTVRCEAGWGDTWSAK